MSYVENLRWTLCDTRLLPYRCAIRRRRHRVWRLQRARVIRKVSDRFDQPSLLVVELIVLGSILQELRQKLQQALLVHDEQLLNVV